MKQIKLRGLTACICTLVILGLFAVLSAADGRFGITTDRSTSDAISGRQLGQLPDGDPVDVTVTGFVVFNGINDPPLSNVQSNDAGSLTFRVYSNDFTDGVDNTRGYVIDQSSFVLTLGETVVGLADPFPDGVTPYFTLADGIPVSDRFWVSTFPTSPGGVPLSQDPFQLDVDLGYVGETLDSLDILDALGTYDFDGLTSFAYNIWAIFPDNVALALDFEQMTIAEPPDDDDKITICHVPPGNPGNAHTITISVNALPAHLAHGDSIGPCDDEPLLGRCCQGGFTGTVCLVNTEEECMSSGQFISWEAGLDCADGDATCEVACDPPCPAELECFTDCGMLVQGVECVLFQADSGGLYLLDDLGGFGVGDEVEVTGCLDPTCISFCLQGDGCLFGNTISVCAAPSNAGTGGKAASQVSQGSPTPTSAFPAK